MCVESDPFLKQTRIFDTPPCFLLQLYSGIQINGGKKICKGTIDKGTWNRYIYNERTVTIELDDGAKFHSTMKAVALGHFCVRPIHLRHFWKKKTVFAAIGWIAVRCRRLRQKTSPFLQATAVYGERSALSREHCQGRKSSNDCTGDGRCRTIRVSTVATTRVAHHLCQRFCPRSDGFQVGVSVGA